MYESLVLVASVIMEQETSEVGPSRHVLVVDDDPIVLEVVRERLEQEGYRVSVRDRALGTTQWIVENRPDVVLLDVMMPALSGSELARVVSERSTETIVVLHSSKSREELEEIGAHARVAGVITKGLSDAQFLREFGRILRRAVRSGSSAAAG